MSVLSATNEEKMSEIRDRVIKLLGWTKFNAMSEAQRLAAEQTSAEMVQSANPALYFGPQSDSKAANDLAKANPFLYQLIKLEGQKLGLI